MTNEPEPPRETEAQPPAPDKNTAEALRYPPGDNWHRPFVWPNEKGQARPGGPLPEPNGSPMEETEQ